MCAKAKHVLLMIGLLASMGPSFGQTTEAPQAAPSQASALAGSADQPAEDWCDDERGWITACEPQRFYASSEYLLWWINKGPVAAPLVTANANPATIAALNEPGTTIQFGPGSGNGLTYRAFSGLRATVGARLGDDDRLTIEGSGFLLERRPVDFNAATGSSTILANPVFLPVPFAGNPAGESSFNSAGAAGSLAVQSSSQLWGAEANGLYRLGTERIQVQLLGGFRYLDLMENLRLTDAFNDPVTGGVLLTQDRFQTRNQFYGGQIGTRLGWTAGQMFAETTLLVALGSSHEVLNIRGATTVTNGAFGDQTGTFIGGVYAEPSNIGRFTRDVFSVVPEVRLRAGYEIGPRLRAFVGYNFLYYSDVLRPGKQIDRNVNANQNGLFGAGTVLPPAVPAPLLQGSGLWAQGISFGLEFRY